MRHKISINRRRECIINNIQQIVKVASTVDRGPRIRTALVHPRVKTLDHHQPPAVIRWISLAVAAIVLAKSPRLWIFCPVNSRFT